MRILGLDISTKTGFNLLEAAGVGDETPKLLECGTITLQKDTILAYGKYPFCYYKAALEMAESIMVLVRKANPDVIVIEETNLGKNRYSQKALEFIHCKVIELLQHWLGSWNDVQVIYLSSSSWRQALELQMTKEQKKANAKLAKAKREAAARGTKLDKKALGVKGKTTKKHVAVDYVNDRFGLALKLKDNDIADAICLTAAFLKQATPCDGT